MTRSEAARKGGIARAARLSPARRQEIARLGFEALVSKRFGGDRAAAIDWFTRKGLASQDAGPPGWNQVFHDPGPMPGGDDDEAL